MFKIIKCQTDHEDLNGPYKENNGEDNQPLSWNIYLYPVDQHSKCTKTSFTSQLHLKPIINDPIWFFFCHHYVTLTLMSFFLSPTKQTCRMPEVGLHNQKYSSFTCLIILTINFYHILPICNWINKFDERILYLGIITSLLVQA